MGRDKAWLDLGGRAMIERVIDALSAATSLVAIIANDPEYTRLGIPVFADTFKNIGPLEAIRTALANSPAPLVALVGCDLPFVTSELLEFLLGLACDYTAVVPVSEAGRPEPLCAIYSTQALRQVSKLIETGERKVSRLFDLVPTRRVGPSEIGHLAGSELFFENVNTPQEYERARERITGFTQI
jgi:molybdenum cofactor guanylyltransferase